MDGFSHGIFPFLSIDPVIVSNAVERQQEHKASGPGRPTQRFLCNRHTLARTDDAPEDIPKSWTCRCDGLVKAFTGINLGKGGSTRRMPGPSPLFR